jgi:nicotinate-nucleotide adenylyltransferase
LNPPPGRIGLLGGTFDPVHLGHLQLAGIARDVCHLEEVWFVPASIPPHKNQQVLADFQQRAEMIELAIADDPHFRLSTIEAALPGPSYTIDTLRHLQTQGAASAAMDFFFIIGADAFLEISTWKSYQQLLRTVHFLVLGRSGCVPTEVVALVERLGYEPDDPAGGWFHPSFHKKIFFLHSPEISIADISSSDIRQRIKARLPVENLVPASVLAYMKAHGLYL